MYVHCVCMYLCVFNVYAPVHACMCCVHLCVRYVCICACMCDVHASVHVYALCASLHVYVLCVCASVHVCAMYVHLCMYVHCMCMHLCVCALCVRACVDMCVHVCTISLCCPGSLLSPTKCRALFPAPLERFSLRSFRPGGPTEQEQRQDDSGLFAKHC